MGAEHTDLTLGYFFQPHLYASTYLTHCSFLRPAGGPSLGCLGPNTFLFLRALAFTRVLATPCGRGGQQRGHLWELVGAWAPFRT